MTKEAFAKLSIVERTQLLRNNPELYNKLKGVWIMSSIYDTSNILVFDNQVLREKLYDLDMHFAGTPIILP